MKTPQFLCILALGLFASPAIATETYSQDFNLTDSFGVNPFRVENAFIRIEPFGPPIRYWQPSTPNVWSEVVYRFDVGFPIETASMTMGVTAYTIGQVVNYDNGAEAYLDVSTDDTNYINVLGAYPNNHDSGQTRDISALVTGSNVIYIRARQIMTVNYGDFNASQFLRGDSNAIYNVTATGVPEPGSAVMLALGSCVLGLIRPRRELRFRMFFSPTH